MSRRRMLALAGPPVVLAAWIVTRGLGLPFPPWPPGGVLGQWHPWLFGFNVGLSYLALLGLYALWGEDTKRRLGNALLALITPGICLVLLEIPALFAWIDYRFVLNTEIEWTPWEGEHNRLDPELIHIHPGHDRIQGQTTGDLTAFGVKPVRSYEIDYQYDRNGFRNHAEYDSAAVVLSGDSFLEGLLVPVEDGVSVRLEQTLRRPVYNLGQSNWGPSHQVPALRRYGLPLAPEMVVWFFFEGNDLKDLIEHAGTQLGFQERIERYDRFRNRSFVRNILWLAALLTNEDDRLTERRSCELSAAEGENATRLYFHYPAEPLTARDDSLMLVAQQELLTARAEAEAAGADLALALVPTKFRVYRDLCSWPESSDLEGWVPNDLPARLEAFAAEHGIPYLDLTPALREASARGELTYFEDDTHWTEAGHAAVAEAVARLLSDRFATPPLADVVREVMAEGAGPRQAPQDGH